MPTVAGRDAAQLWKCCAIKAAWVKKLSVSVVTECVGYKDTVLDYPARLKVNVHNCKVC